MLSNLIVPFLQTKNLNNRCYNQKVAAFNLGVSEAVKVFPNCKNFLIFSLTLSIIQSCNFPISFLSRKFLICATVQA